MFIVHYVFASARFGGLAAIALSLVACSHLPPFGADLGKRLAGHDEIRLPYATTLRYYGWIAPGSPPDEIRDGKKMFYLYAWIPENTAELGVRMVSPARLAGAPDTQVDFVEPTCTSHNATSIYFDTWVRFERCLAAISPEDIAKPCQQWVSFGDNDDSEELPPNPSGQRYNSVLRVTSNVDDPLKVLVRGMYRIAFTSYKVGEVQGTFAAEVGSVNPLRGAALARTPAVLAARVAQLPTSKMMQISRGVETAADDTAPAESTVEAGHDDALPSWEQ